MKLVFKFKKLNLINSFEENSLNFFDILFFIHAHIKKIHYFVNETIFVNNF